MDVVYEVLCMYVLVVTAKLREKRILVSSSLSFLEERTGSNWLDRHHFGFLKFFRTPV